jgi:hypothetical protein
METAVAAVFAVKSLWVEHPTSNALLIKRENEPPAKLSVRKQVWDYFSELAMLVKGNLFSLGASTFPNPADSLAVSSDRAITCPTACYGIASLIRLSANSQRQPEEPCLEEGPNKGPTSCFFFVGQKFEDRSTKFETIPNDINPNDQNVFMMNTVPEAIFSACLRLLNIRISNLFRI